MKVPGGGDINHHNSTYLPETGGLVQPALGSQVESIQPLSILDHIADSQLIVGERAYALRLLTPNSP